MPFGQAPGINDSVLLMGDINIDAVMTVDYYPREGDEAVARSFTLRLGGSACNTAAALSRLGVKARLIANMGGDALARIAREELDRTGIDQSLVRELAGESSGFLLSAVSRSGERTMFGDRGANRLPAAEDLRRQGLLASCGLHVSGYTALEEGTWDAVRKTLEECQAAGKWTSLDPSVEAAGRARGSLLAVMPLVGHWLVSRRELQLLSGEEDIQAGLDALHARGAPSITLKLGSEGSLFSGGGLRVTLPACPVPWQRDTTGAGDVFAAGYILGLLQGCDPPERLAFGNALASMAVEAGDGQRGLLEYTQITEELEQRRKKIMSNWSST
jgi:ribokinase